MARDKRAMPPRQAVSRVVSRFIKSYIQKQGFRDGFLGFMVAWPAAANELLSYANYWQAKKKPGATELRQQSVLSHQ